MVSQSPIAVARSFNGVLVEHALDVDEDLLVIRRGDEHGVDVREGQRLELLVRHGENHAVRVVDVLEIDQRRRAFLLCALGVGLGVNEHRRDAKLVQTADDVVHLAVARVRAVLLERNAEDDDLRIAHLLAGENQLLDRRVRHELTHAVIHLAAGEDDLAVIAELLGLVSKVIGIDADTMAADETGAETERVPLGVHALDDLSGVDAHAVKDHGKLVHEGNIDIALAVLDHLDRLGGLDGGNRVGADLNDNIVNVLDLLERLSVHAGDDLLDVLQTVHLVAGVDALGGVAHLEVHAALEAGLALQNRHADVLRHAGIDRGLIDHDGALGEVAADDAAGVLHRLEIRSVILVDRRRHRDDVEARLAQTGFIRREVHSRFGNDLIAHLMRGIDAGLVEIDAVLISVKANDLHALGGKRHGEGHTDIAETDEGDFRLAGFDFFIQGHFVISLR